MPNWVTHKLTITAKPQALRAFLAEHLKSLEAQLAEQRDAAHQIDETGEPIEVLAIFPDGTIEEEVREPKGPALDFETLITLHDGDATEVWGAKWNASLGRLDGDPECGAVTLWFDTPWSIPEPIFEAIANQYPEFSADGHAFDELWNFAAQITIRDGVAEVNYVTPTADLYREVYGKDPETIPDHTGDEDEDENENDPEGQLVDQIVGHAQHLAQKYGLDPSGRPLNTAVQTWLDKQEWPYDHSIEDDNCSQFQCRVQIASQSYRVFIDVNEDSEQVGVFFYTTFSVPTDRADEMAVMLNWVNNTISIGSLIGPNTDEPMPVQWKAVIDVEGSKLSGEQIGTLIYAGVNTFWDYGEAISMVALTEATAEAAIEKWEHERRLKPQ